MDTKEFVMRQLKKGKRLSEIKFMLTEKGFSYSEANSIVNKLSRDQADQNSQKNSSFSPMQVLGLIALLAIAASCFFYFQSHGSSIFTGNLTNNLDNVAVNVPDFLKEDQSFQSNESNNEINDVNISVPDFVNESDNIHTTETTMDPSITLPILNQETTTTQPVLNDHYISPSSPP